MVAPGCCYADGSFAPAAKSPSGLCLLTKPRVEPTASLLPRAQRATGRWLGESTPLPQQRAHAAARPTGPSIPLPCYEVSRKSLLKGPSQQASQPGDSAEVPDHGGARSSQTPAPSAPHHRACIFMDRPVVSPEHAALNCRPPHKSTYTAQTLSRDENYNNK